MDKFFSRDPSTKKNIYIGSVNKGVFTRLVKQKHFFRKHQAYPIPLDVLIKLDACDCKAVIFKLSKSEFYATLDLFFDNDKIKTEDFGNGKQVFLPKKEMKKLTKQRNLI